MKAMNRYVESRALKQAEIEQFGGHKGGNGLPTDGDEPGADANADAEHGPEDSSASASVDEMVDRAAL